jgi:hypothetical protein
MPRKSKQYQISERKQHIARITKKRLTIVILSLLVVLAFFVLKPWADLWPTWMIDIRKGFIAIAGILTVLLILMSPIIVATESDPRPLSRPGKDPRFSVFNSWKQKD